MCAIRVGPGLAAAFTGAVFFCNLASAEPAFQSDLFARYPNAAASLPGCNACHDSPPSLNPFGQAFLANGLVLDAALDALDSDGDSIANGEELRASPATNPGDPNSRPGLAAPPGPPSAPSPPATDGPALYGSSCAACHGPLANSGKLGATLARTQAAIAGNVGGMGYLSTLSTSQLEAIVAALGPAPGSIPAVSSSNYTGMWWDPAESGWGLTVNHQGNTVFATLFTYSEAGVPMWLVMSAGQMQADGRTFSGDLYRATGPAFDAAPFTPVTAANLEAVGTMSITFSGASAASLSYTFGGIAVTKSIVQHVFGTAAATCTATTGSRAALTNYQDLWWSAAEPGWGI
ncbi:MAG: cytochrome c, partial [Betaproteobacteria bacterium]|nr:cytochrome c [Betaproteobacteria bacterium]